MAILVSDIIPKIKDLSRNQNLDDVRVIRAIDTASTFVFNQLGIPEHEFEYEFDFDSEQYYYTLPEGFGEFIFLRYKDDNLNNNNRFIYRPIEFIFEEMKTGKSLFSFYNAKGIKQLVVIANNSISSLPIDTFDYNNLSRWVALNDATNISDDKYTYKEGTGSLRFDINTSLSGLNRASLKRIVAARDLYPQKDVGHFKFYLYLPTISGISSVSFNWGSDLSNYYKSTVTTQEDGSPFQVGWNNIDCKWEGAVQVGTPNDRNITFYQIDIDYDASFTSTNNFRVDYLRLKVPDKMILTYYTNYKARNSSGNYIKKLSDVSDEFLWGDTSPEIGDILALHSAIILNPQILVDDSYVRKIYQEYYTIFNKKFPRKRAMNFLFSPKI
jgi:hypothetical protein